MTPEQIRALRERRGWSLDQAAAHASVDRMTWWRWEQEPAHPQHMAPQGDRLVRLRELDGLWVIEQEHDGEWHRLGEPMSQEEATLHAQALRSLMSIGATPDAAVRIEPVG